MTMRAVSVKPPGGLNDLSIVSQTLPVIGKDDCLIKVYYSAVNRADLLQRKGLYPPPPGESDVMGLEAVGVVEQCDNSTRWKKGDKVMALLGGGGYAEYARVNKGHLMPMPHSLSFRQAAAIPEVWLTAFQLIFWISDVRTRIDDAPNLYYLAHAGASGVGTSLIQLLTKVIKTKNVFVTVGSDDKRKYIHENFGLASEFLINYKTEDFQSQVLNVTKNRGVDYVFDCVGSNYWHKNADSLAVDGQWILYGTLTGGNVNGELLSKLMRKRIHLKASTLRARSTEYKERLINDFETNVLKHFENGELKPIIDSEYSLDDIKSAHGKVESNETIGKVLLKVYDPTDAKNDL